tara:strand:- start:1737 stop:2369 length:633 start_codon:yes stop_codon:yes gene_type:complete
MKNYDFKVHWNKAYKNSERENLGWFENDLSESFNLIQKCKLSKDSRIFNAGAGESLLIKKLQKFGYSNILINDISDTAIKKLKNSLDNHNGLHFIIEDLTNPTKLLNIEKVDLWHDRAVLHFFIKKNQQKTYFNLIKSKIRSGGYVIFSEFALDGAKKCCGLEILNYDNEMFKNNLGDDFQLIDTFDYLYKHPSNGNTRKYIYSLFKRKK